MSSHLTYKSIALVLIVLLLLTGCEAVTEASRAQAERAEAVRIEAESAAERARIEAEAERDAARIAAEADAEAQRALADARRQDAATENLRVLGDNAIKQSVAQQIDANTQSILAQAAQQRANAWAVYGLVGVVGLLALAVALWLFLNGVANVRQTRMLSGREHQVIDVETRGELARRETWMPVAMLRTNKKVEANDD